MSLLHAARWAIAIGYLLMAVLSLLNPKWRLPYAYASAIVAFGLAVSQLAGMAKDALSFLDGLALIVMGVACGLLLGESIRRHVAEKRPEANGTVEA